jgi:histidinol-phosphate aminotransferase
MNLKQLVKKEVSALRAYQAKEISCSVKLDANESPYGFRAALRAAAAIQTNRYPDPEAKKLRAVLARDLGVRPQNILQGNGSDEIIYHLIATFGGPVLYPVPTFSMYGIISQVLGEKKVAVPLDRDFDLDQGKMLKALRKNRPRIVFLSTPNNPTGNCFSSDRILKIVESSPGIVVVDEAYQPFASDKGFLPLLKDYKNLVIMRTLSKIGLAAIRFGFLVADEEIIHEVNKVRLPFNVNALSQAVAVEVLKDRKALRTVIRTIAAERDLLMRAMEGISTITTFPSEANFILFRVADPDRIHTELLRRGILIRNVADAVEGCLRVTVGTPRENRKFLHALRSCMEESS